MTTAPPRWPRLLVVRALLPAGIFGALVLSAAATVTLAGHHDVPAGVRPFAVGMLEVVSVAGTLLAIFATTPRLRRRAMVGVAGVGGVQLVAGWSAYGWFGAVGPVLAVYLVHLSAEAWQELRCEPTQVVRQPATESHRTTAAAQQWGPPTSVPAATPSTPPAARVTPLRRPSTRAQHAPGWSEALAAVPRDGMPTEKWVRRRARALGVAQNGRKLPALRLEVEGVEVARAPEAVAG